MRELDELRIRIRRIWKRCPAGENLAAYADARLEGPPRASLEAHLVSCSECLSAVASLSRLKDLDPPAAAPDYLLARARRLVEDRPRRRSPLWGWQVAGATAAVATLALVMVRKPAPPVLDPAVPATETPAPAVVPPKPSPAPSRTVRSIPRNSGVPSLLSPVEGSRLPVGSGVIRWSAVERALSYQVEVLTEEGDIAWQTSTESLSVPLRSTARLGPGRRYYVHVRALLPNGKSLRSAAVGFELAERP